MKRGGIAALVAIMVLGRGSDLVQGQSASSSLAGKVRSEDGSHVADAVVQARAETTGVIRTTVTDAKNASVAATWTTVTEGSSSFPRTASTAQIAPAHTPKMTPST